MCSKCTQMYCIFPTRQGWRIVTDKPIHSWNNCEFFSRWPLHQMFFTEAAAAPSCDQYNTPLISNHRDEFNQSSVLRLWCFHEAALCLVLWCFVSFDSFCEVSLSKIKVGFDAYATIPRICLSDTLSQGNFEVRFSDWPVILPEN